MAVTAAQITRVRSLSAAPAADFSDAAIEDVIELYECIDSAGYLPDEDDYTTTYDIYAAAADIVDQRAAAAATLYDTSADGANLSRNQITQNLTALASRLRARAVSRLTRRTIEETADADDCDDDEEGNS